MLVNDVNGKIKHVTKEECEGAENCQWNSHATKKECEAEGRWAKDDCEEACWERRCQWTSGRCKKKLHNTKEECKQECRSSGWDDWGYRVEGIFQLSTNSG